MKNEKKLHKKKYFEIESENNNCIGLVYAQISAYDKAALYFNKSIAISDSIKKHQLKNRRKLIAESNMLNLFLDSKQYVKLDSLAILVKKECLKNKSSGIYYYYQTKLRSLFVRKNYDELLRTSEEALDFLNNEEFFKNLDEIETIKSLKNRFIAIYLLFNTYALFENDKKNNNANNNLDFLLSQKLESVLWNDEYLWMHKVNLYLYKTKYFLKYDNKDSLNYYLNLFNNQSLILNNYLRNKKKHSNEFLLKSIDNEVALERSNSQLIIENEKATKYKIINIFLILIVIVSIIIFIKREKNKRDKVLMDNRLKVKNHELEKSFLDKKNLEEKINAIQNEISKDLHDNFGNRFAAIITSNSILESILNKNTFNALEFNKFSEFLKNNIYQLMIDVKDLIWASNSENNSIFRIAQRIENIAIEFSKLKDLNIEFNYLILNDKSTPNYWNKQFILIVKEALNNIIKHAGATKVEMKLEYLKTSNKLSLYIKDNGIGFKVNEVKRSSGLSNMKSRAKTLDLDLIIESNINEGTLINIKGGIV
ncbi:sensor histidine kinase [Lutibacter sp. Hel_I_33_5]|uniref:sensor histidine kinase n=1 Tax=Lutibacter sp. Hel_I_33_5 TaxID=1566289 RepID=UPI001C94818A|nr:ATP-binding protein [Lutibacter sp. Hel_I_33_5]